MSGDPAQPGEGDDAGDAARPGRARHLGDPGGVLYVVATPIGNLGDITLRALETLRTVPLVAAEDTRHTRRLWARHGIETRLTSHHAQSAPARVEALLAHLRDGSDLALVTDAGTPLVSDPGEDLVARWAAAGGRVVPIPGASSVLAALVASGIPAARWGFEGFLPRRGAERKARLRRIAADDRATVLFEAPGRTAATLRDLAAACGADRRAAVCRELTKLHEEVLRGRLGELATATSAKPPRGEVTIVVAGAADTAHPSAAGLDPAAGDATTDSAAPPRAGPGEAAVTPPPDTAALAAAHARVDELVAGGIRRSQAARRVAAETGLPRRDLFREPPPGPPSGSPARRPPRVG